jgi:hypothetical protein
VIDGMEDSEDYPAFEAAVIADYDAQTAVERELVLRLASLLRRLRRIISIETDLLRIQSEIARERRATLGDANIDVEQDPSQTRVSNCNRSLRPPATPPCLSQVEIQLTALSASETLTEGLLTGSTATMPHFGSKRHRHSFCCIRSDDFERLASS